MANSVNLSQNAALHQLRISQIPLRPSEQGNVGACGQNLLIHSQEEHPESVEKLSSLDHVRYNIVGKYHALFRNRIHCFVNDSQTFCELFTGIIVNHKV